MQPPMRVLLVALCTLAGTVSGAHITDQLVVGLYDGPAAEGTPSRLLSSGTPLEVLRREGTFAEVRLADDTRGWVESTYVTEEKPAKAMLLETQAKLRQMGLELAALREKQTSGEVASPVAAGAGLPSARDAQLQQALHAAEQRIAQLEAQQDATPGRDTEDAQRLQALEERVAQAVALLSPGAPATAESPAPLGPIERFRSWIVGAIALLLGFGGGVAYVDYRIRRRYHGFRL